MDPDTVMTTAEPLIPLMTTKDIFALMALLQAELMQRSEENEQIMQSGWNDDAI
jgi:hypothetical protein